MRKLLTLLAATIAMTMFACTKDPLLGDTGSIKSIDITDAQYIYSQSKFNPATETSTTKLYKITKSGATAEVLVLDQNGKLVEIDPVFLISDMNSNLCVISFYGETRFQEYIVNKSDGTAHKVPDSPNFQFGMLSSADRNDNIYCFGSGNQVSASLKVTSIFRISQSPTGAIDYKNITGKYDANSINADYDGNVLFSVFRSGGLTCCVTPNNKIIESTSLPQYIFNIKGNGGFYYFNPDGDLMKIYPNESENDFDITKIASCPTIAGLRLRYGMVTNVTNRTIYFVEGRMIIIDNNDPTKTEVRDCQINFDDVFSTRQTDRYIYLFYANECPPIENSKIIRFDQNDLSWKYVLEPNKYTIWNYELSLDDVIRFSGYNLNTRNKVLVTITPDGQMTEEKYDDKNPTALSSQYIKLR